MTLADVAVIAATVLAWWSLIPQIRKLIRTEDATGVSGTWPAIGLVSNAAWTAYLVSQALWAATPATTVMVFFYFVVLRTLKKANVSLQPPFVRGLLSAALLGAAFGFGSWTVLGLVLGWAYVPQLLPAVWAAYRTPKPYGVSTGTWALIGVEGAVWFVYGALLDDTPVVIFGFVGLVASVLILARVWATIGFGRRAHLVRP
ncbi:MAG: PQ-loop domain-containing transporter [Acidimicrobiia bacterium]